MNSASVAHSKLSAPSSARGRPVFRTTRERDAWEAERTRWLASWFVKPISRPLPTWILRERPDAEQILDEEAALDVERAAAALIQGAPATATSNPTDSGADLPPIGELPAPNLVSGTALVPSKSASVTNPLSSVPDAIQVHK